MSRSRFLNKVSAQGIFRGQQIDLLSWLCFVRCLLLSFLFHCFYAVSYLEGKVLCHGSTLVDLLQKSETDSQKRSYFKRFYNFGTKNQQNWAD